MCLALFIVIMALIIKYLFSNELSFKSLHRVMGPWVNHSCISTLKDYQIRTNIFIYTQDGCGRTYTIRHSCVDKPMWRWH
jgi:hypothetical protein